MQEFKVYLEKQGLKANTVVDYYSRVLRIAKAEKLTIDNLAKNITKIIVDYDKKGKKQDIGKRSHSSVINALKHFLKFNTTATK